MAATFRPRTAATPVEQLADVKRSYPFCVNLCAMEVNTLSLVANPRMSSGLAEGPRNHDNKELPFDSLRKEGTMEP